VGVEPSFNGVQSVRVPLDLSRLRSIEDLQGICEGLEGYDEQAEPQEEAGDVRIHRG